MGWERRGNQMYYYRKKRIGKKVVSEYIGTGPIAERIAQEDELERQKQEEERQSWLDSQSEIESIDDTLEALEFITRKLIHAHLLLSGFHSHKGQWRIRRNG